ncbi:MAG: tetratricopeptide repeat protein [Candidatus Helarchaeota archaeon]
MAKNVKQNMEGKKMKKSDRVDKKSKASKKVKEKGHDTLKGPQNIKIFTWQMEKFQVVLSDSDNIMVALMLESEPSEAVKKALINFTYQFETNYEDAIKNFRGNLKVFSSARPLAEDIFNLFLMQPQMLPIDLKKALRGVKIDDAEKKLIKTAQKLQEEKGYFFFTHLISEHNKKFKVNQTKMFKMIFDLHSKGIFLSIPPERVFKEIEKQQLYKKLLCEVGGLCDTDLDILIKDLLVSSPESREALLDKIRTFKKKTISESIQQEILKRNTMRKKRSELFDQLDQYLQANEYENALKTFDEIIQISNELGDFKMAQELKERAENYKKTIEQMATIVPQLRSARNDALNKAELYELGGKYSEAAECYKMAAEYSVQLGELEHAKEYQEHAERMKSLEELAKLRRSLGA